ncbi:MAG: lytic murein transglycosylase [Sphingomicrobium sp.]
MGVAVKIFAGALAAIGASDTPTAPMAAVSAQTSATTASYWETYKVRLAILARNAGVRPATVAANVPGLAINWTAMRMEATEPGSASTNSGIVYAIAPYIRRHVNPSIINRGRANYRQHYQTIHALEARTGVEPTILLAIWGHETSYGTVTGNYDLLEALASLAYQGRRRDFFEAEFIAAMKLMDQGVPRWRLKGSWAGATGHPQFMPSVALRLRADGDGDGVANIWNNEFDGLASIAMYLRDAGWKPNIPWGVEARIPANLNRAAIVSRVIAPRCPQVFRRHSRWLTMAEWRSLGVIPAAGTAPIPDTELATLFEANAPPSNGYLLTANYRAILDYNCSNFYAMSVGLLADEIARR